jgi:hypothetical protein
MLGIFVWFTQVISYSYTVLINPGVVKREMSIKLFHSSTYKLSIKNYRVCSICQVVMNMDEQTAHCDDCGVCIEGSIYII